MGQGDGVSHASQTSERSRSTPGFLLLLPLSLSSFFLNGMERLQGSSLNYWWALQSCNTWPYCSAWFSLGSFLTRWCSMMSPPLEPTACSAVLALCVCVCVSAVSPMWFPGAKFLLPVLATTFHQPCLRDASEAQAAPTRMHDFEAYQQLASAQYICLSCYLAFLFEVFQLQVSRQW